MTPRPPGRKSAPPPGNPPAVVPRQPPASDPERRPRRSAASARPSAPLRWRLRLPAPYDLGWVLGFLADRAAPSLERVDAAGLVRVVRVEGVPAVLDLRFGPDAAAPRWLAATAELAVAGVPGPASAGPLAMHLRRLIRRMLDLDTDLEPFHDLARRDPLLGPLVARHPGLRLPQLPDPFEGAVRAIVGQQVSVAGARTVIDRLIRAFGEPLPANPGLVAFPHPAALAAARPERVTALGLTRAKAAALLALAAASSDGTLDWERLRAAPADAAQAELVSLPGIGPWTASYIRMRALGDRDAFPASDLGIVKALAPHASPAEISALAEGWRPFRAYAAIHLWRSLGA